MRTKLVFKPIIDQFHNKQTAGNLYLGKQLVASFVPKVTGEKICRFYNLGLYIESQLDKLEMQ